MPTPLKLRTFNIYDDPKRGEGLRIGTTRKPPRGVTKQKWKNYFDVWFPIVAPSAKLLKRFSNKSFDQPMVRQKFFKSYEVELNKSSGTRQALKLLAELAKRTPISIGCYCAEDQRCHRSHLKKLIERATRKS